MTTALPTLHSEPNMDTILQKIYLLIESLKHDYVYYSIRGHQRSIDRGESVDHHQLKIEELRNGICSIDYVVETGKKYHKIIMIDSGGSRSSHAFVDKQTGDVYKSASWKAPARGIRYSLLDDDSREQCYANCDWAGGYLYA